MSMVSLVEFNAILESVKNRGRPGAAQAGRWR
jgi:hypothetical protein